jgi:hypothetical protein
MALYLSTAASTGRTLFATLERLSDGAYWNASTGAWAANPAAGDRKISLTEGTGANLESYTATVTDSDLGTYRIRIRIHDDADANDKTLLVSEVSLVDGAEASGTLTATDVWAAAVRTLTQSAAQVTAIVQGSDITVRRGDTWSITLTGLGNISSRTKLYFTVKASTDSPDTAALLKVEESAGLQILNGSSSVTAGDASITVNSAVTGSITIALAAAKSAGLPATREDYYYDVQMVTASAVSTLTDGNFTVEADVTRATS